MAYNPDKRFHEEWLGLAQPIDGLLFSPHVLEEAQLLEHVSRDTLAEFREHLEVQSATTGAAQGEGGLSEGRPGDAAQGAAITDLIALLDEVYGYDEEVLHRGDDLDERLVYYADEGREELRPRGAIIYPDNCALQPKIEPAESTPAIDAGRQYMLLCDEIELGTPFDKASSSGPHDEGWQYPPAAKFERLLRHCRVPLGLLSNGHAIRFIYAPHGEASASMTWNIEAMSQPGGRALLSAFGMLFDSNAIFSHRDERMVLGLLAASRTRQASVTNALADQVYEAIKVLLAGFAAADERQGSDRLAEVLREKGEEHVYRGLLTTLLRLVFIFYAEELDVLPANHPFYAKHLSLLALYDELQDDAGRYPETMVDRRGAWPRVLALFRAIYDGISFYPQHEPDAAYVEQPFELPKRHGGLFNPARFGFLEGRPEDSDTLTNNAAARSLVQVPEISDDVVFRVLQNLLYVDGERLSYRALDVEQIGSVYERLMGYHVVRLTSAAVCMNKTDAWIALSDIEELELIELRDLIKAHTGLTGKKAESFARALRKARSDDERLALLSEHRRKNTPDAPPFSYVIQPGEERQSTSSHYTPRSLTHSIVRQALDPVMAALGEQPRSADLLNLKVCDPAMGSGAFLVEACRYIADRVVAAWHAEGAASALSAKHDDLTLHARRLVAQRCLYGVDKNEMAVDLARVSLWLITLDRALPFTFVDHALRHGDTLVGFSLNQARGFHWEPSGQIGVFTREVDSAINAAIGLRREILERASYEGPQAQDHKEMLLKDAEEASARAMLIADVALGAFFAADKTKAREAELLRRQELLHEYLSGDEQAERELKTLQKEFRESHQPFHWMLEFPEIFYDARPDPLAGNDAKVVAWMDAFIGNPPFGGKNNITAANGEHMITWLQVIHRGADGKKAHGNADYSAHFFQRAAALLGDHGVIGLIATNTIGQGDTRSAGLQALVKRGFEIVAAQDSWKWPGEANVTASTVILARGTPAVRYTKRVFDGEEVEAINSRLRPKPERPDPVKLAENAGKSFVGAYVLGMGFVLTSEERDALVAKDPRNAERIFPYLGGREVNSNPDQGFERYVINFGEMSLAEAEAWPDLLAIVREKVKPERDRLKNNADGRRRKKYWWQYGRYTPALFSALRSVERCVVTARVSKHVMFSFQPSDRLVSEAAYVFPVESAAFMTCLQSRVHVNWAWMHSSTMKSDIRYSATDCFENFPFPAGYAENAELEALGERLHTERRAWTMAQGKGLTQLYNALKDPQEHDDEIAALRELHLEVDHAVLRAYGWSDIAVPPFVEYAADDESDEALATRSAQDAFRDEVMDRLYALNAARARGHRKAPKAKGSATPTNPDDPQGSLL